MKLSASENMLHKGCLKSTLKMSGQFAEYVALNPFMHYVKKWRNLEILRC